MFITDDSIVELEKVFLLEYMRKVEIGWFDDEDNFHKEVVEVTELERA